MRLENKLNDEALRGLKTDIKNELKHGKDKCAWWYISRLHKIKQEEYNKLSDFDKHEAFLSGNELSYPKTVNINTYDRQGCYNCDGDDLLCGYNLEHIKDIYDIDNSTMEKILNYDSLHKNVD